MNDLLENAKRNSKITLEEFFFEFYSKILEFELGESDLMIRAGSSTCHFVISNASSYTCMQNLMNYSNEGFFMIFTESEDLGNNTKLFAQDIATLNDATVYSVGATFIVTKK